MESFDQQKKSCDDEFDPVRVRLQNEKLSQQIGKLKVIICLLSFVVILSLFFIVRAWTVSPTPILKNDQPLAKNRENAMTGAGKVKDLAAGKEETTGDAQDTDKVAKLFQDPFAQRTDDKMDERKDDEASLTRLDHKEIMDAIIQIKGDLMVCILKLRKKTDVASNKIKLNLTINSSGKVSKFSVNDSGREVGGEQLCFKSIFSKVKLRPFEGDSVNVEIPFIISR